MATSDHELYQLFQAIPQYLDAFVEMQPNRNYTFESVTFKKVQRQCDGLLRSDDPNETTVIFEFQMQKKPDIYSRIIGEMSFYSQENPNRSMLGIIVFKDPSTDPGDLNWGQLLGPCPKLLRVLYLNQVYKDLAGDPLQAILGPFVEKDPNEIRKKAPEWYKQLHKQPLKPKQREITTKVFLSFLMNALPGITEKELRHMASLVGDLSHTQFYKDMEKKFGTKGRREGLQEGLIKGRIEQLQELLRENQISQSYFDKKMAELKR